MKNNILYLDKDFANRVFAIENRFDKMGPYLLLINGIVDYEKYFGALYRDINLLSGIFKHFDDMSSNLHATLDYYLNVYFGYLEIISYIVEFKSLYSQNPSFVIGDERLFSSYNKVASLMDEGGIIAPKFFDNMTILLENLAEHYGYDKKLYKMDSNLNVKVDDTLKRKIYSTVV